MTRVTHADCGGHTIGAEMNKLKQAYQEAISLAKSNGDKQLAFILTKCLHKICDADEEALEAIVMVQKAQ